MIPALHKTRGVALHSVATASGVASESARQLFGFAHAAQPSEVLQDKDADAIFVFSRHDSHSQYVAAALAHHKPVLVEKPLAINREQLEEIRAAYQAEKEKGLDPFLMVGYNRRFAPLTGKVRDFFAGHQEPWQCRSGSMPDSFLMIIGCRKLAKAAGSWASYATSWTGPASWWDAAWGKSLPVRCRDGPRYHRDNVFATLTFQDGSIANLSYLGNGDKSVPKEEFEVFCEGRVARISDFTSLELSSDGKTRRDKGNEGEIAATVEAMRSGGNSPSRSRN